jgi:hypothetical protein
MEEKSGIDVSDGLANYVSDSLATAPPPLWLVIRIASGDDANSSTTAESFLKKKPAPPRVGVFCNDIDTSNLRIVIPKPAPQRNRRTKGPIPIVHMRRYHLDAVGWNSGSLHAAGPDAR